MTDGNLSEIIRAFTTDADYRAALTAQLQARTVDPALLEALITYARSRQASMAQAIARKMLTEAGVSWEAL